MGTIASTARIRLNGFNTEGVDIYSPLEDQVVLTYRAVAHFATVNGFTPYQHRGVTGRAGPMVMRRITDTLFDHADKDVRDKINGLVTQVLKKTDAVVCVVHPANREIMPTWFVADHMPPNLTIVALGHSTREAPKPLVPTRGENRLTAEQAGETLPPGEVTVTQTVPYQDRTEALRALHEKAAEEREGFVTVISEAVSKFFPATAADLHILTGEQFHLSTVRDILRELEADGKVVSRQEEDSERLIRGGGLGMPKGKRANLYAPAPGPVPERTALPEGIAPARAASTWDIEKKERLDSWCDKILEELGRSYPKGTPTRPRSIGKLSEVTGLTQEQTKLALDRLIKLEMIYDNGHYMYYLIERRRGPRVDHQPPATDQPTVAPAPQETPATVPVVPASSLLDEVIRGVHALAAQAATAADTESREQLQAEVTALTEKVEKQAKIIASLRAAIAAMEE